MGKQIFTALVMCLVLLVSNANAKILNNGSDRVVAVVSGSVITQQELEARLELAKRQINQAIPKDQLPAIYQKILNDLINEEVQRQFATKHNIEVTDSELDLAIAEIEKRNGWSHGAFYAIAKNIESTAKAKIRSDLVRQKIIDRRLRSRVNVSKAEIDRLIDNINSDNSTEKKIHQIFIEVDKKSQEKQVAKQMRQIYNDLASDPSKFVQYAKNFDSDSTFKESVDDLGWFGEGELTPDLDKALKKLNKGQMSQPILTNNGWHILYVEDVRQPNKLDTTPVQEYQLYKVTYTFDKETDKAKQLETFKEMVADFDTMGDAEELVLKNADKDAFSNSMALGWVKEKNLPPAAAKQIQALEINGFTAPIVQDDYVEVYHLTNKRETLPAKLQEYRNRIYSRLMSSRVELAARRFMRDLRRQAYIEIRL
ncbi:MAG: hypothetical protein CMF60_03280 [Magnetococcales bacterium]|nr:hypothetical protein [Magnetococcales bacterium]|tara:strand:+ start:7556 stop:8833 length:1278 start_codon:yes stop_codon:yes gene_type:complete